MDSKRFVLAEVKQADGDSTNGEFEAVLSAPTLDRDNEIIDTGAFEPLPSSIPVHAYHDFRDPIGRGVPFYEGPVLKLRGFYASTPRAQEIRTLVAEGVIASMSVGFMADAREEGEDGKTHVTNAELLEGSMVSIPSNREAAVLMAKTYADSKTSGDEPVETPNTDPEDEAGSPTGADAPVGDPAEPPADVDEEQLNEALAEALAAECAALARL